MTAPLPVPAAPGELTPAWLTAALRASGAFACGAVVAVDWAVIGGVAVGAATAVAAFLDGSLDVAERRASEDEILRRPDALLLEHGVVAYSPARLARAAG